MALIACRECSKQISDQAAACPHCGMPQTPATQSIQEAQPLQAPKKEVSIWVWVIVVPAVCLAVAAATGACTPSADSEAKAHARRAIDLCWSEQARKSITPGEARFIAGACEKMERDFRSKWGVNP